MAKQSIKRFIMTILVVVLSGAVPVAGMIEAAQAVSIPMGLKPGDRYYLAFITDGQIAATSGDIKTYNDFVNTEAGKANSKAAGATWVAVASTATTDAIDNLNFAGQSLIAPIYLLDGKTQVVKQAQDLFSGNALLNGISIDQFGNATRSLNVWTGTDTNGKKAKPLGGAPVTLGRPGRTDSAWIITGAGAPQFPDDLYAVSKLLTVPAPIPSSWPLLTTGFASLLGYGWRRKRQAAAPMMLA